MGRTLTLEEAKGRTAYDLIQEAIGNAEPLIVSLEDGTTVSIQEYQPSLMTEQTPTEALLTLKPLPQLRGFIPANWKEAVYGEDGTGTP